MTSKNGRTRIETLLLEFLQEEVFDALVALDETTNLLESGFDSLALLRVLHFAEQRLGVHIPEAEITETRIQTVRNLAEWINALGTAKQVGA